MRNAYGQRTKCTAAGHRARACSSCLRALSERSRIARLAIPFWKWALTPQKVSLCCASAVVTVIVCNFYAVVGGELFEGAFGFDCFVERRILHKMDEADAGKMVDEDGGAKFSCHLCEKSNLC